MAPKSEKCQKGTTVSYLIITSILPYPSIVLCNLSAFNRTVLHCMEQRQKRYIL